MKLAQTWHEAVLRATSYQTSTPVHARPSKGVADLYLPYSAVVESTEPTMAFAVWPKL